MGWLLFAIIGNLLFSVESIIDQLLRRNHVRHDASLNLLWMFFFLAAWLLVVPFIDVSIPSAPRLIAAVLAGFISLFVGLPYFYALSNEEVSRVMPMWQFSSVFVLLFSVIFLGEALAANDYYGFALLFMAGMLLSFEGFGRGFRLNRTLLMVACASVLWAVVITLKKFFYMDGDFWNGFFWFGIGSFLGALFLMAFPGNFRHLKGSLRLLTRKGFSFLAASTLIAFFAQLSLLAAIRNGPASLVSVIGGTQMVFVFLMTVALSRFFPRILKERIDGKTLLTKAAAIALMIAGIAFISRGV